MSERNTGTISFTLDLEHPPTLTPDQRERLSTMREEDIDLKDIPDQAGKGGWTRPGLKGRSLDEVRQSAMRKKLLLLDDRVVEFFKQSGEEAPAKMNAVLLEYVESHRKSA